MSLPQDWLVEARQRLRVEALLLHLDPRVRRRLDASDLVQKTMVKAQENLGQFRGSTPAEFLGWLREILHNQVRDEMRRLHADKRDVAREQSLNKALAESSARLEAVLAATGSSPSEHCQRQEFLERLALFLDAALEHLPEAQRDAVILHKLQGMPYEEIARKLERSEKAVRDLVHRGLYRLKNIPELQKLFQEFP